MSYPTPQALDTARANAANAKWEAAEAARDTAIEAEEKRWYDTHATCRRCQPIAQNPTTDEIVDHGCYQHADFDELHAHYQGPTWRDRHVDVECQVCERIARRRR